MKQSLSLRLRLTLIILLPLLLIAAGIGTWALREAELRGQERFDLSLLSTALAISRDVALSDGDALSLATRDLIRDTSGGEVFYHAYAPDGVFVTGYASPPVPDLAALQNDEAQTYFDAIYQGQSVRVLRLKDAMQIDGLSGDFTFTVWQNTDVRDALVRDLATQTFIVIATLIVSLALIVWFGVSLGLRPLNDLEQAISRRSPDDLSAIQRAVPAEVRGIVGTLNALLGQVAATIETKNAFISNAAHQLRNPLAGVLAMAQAVRSSPNEKAAQERSADLVDAAQHASNLANQLLTFERANAMEGEDGFASFDLVALLQDLVGANHTRFAAQSVSLTLTTQSERMPFLGDALMIREAVSNLLDNALIHGGDGLSQIDLDLRKRLGEVQLTVSDNGIGIAPDQQETALERFGQVSPVQGSGLGLPIAQAVALRHNGTITLGSNKPGLRVRLTFSENGTL